MRYAVNCSLLFNEYPLFERAAAAKAAGFDYVEYWWPWDVPVPSDDQIQEFIEAIKASGAQLIGLNFYAGTMPGPGRGVLSSVSRHGEFRDNVPVALAIGRELGCRAFNALYGNRQPEEDPRESDDVALAGLRYAAAEARQINGTALIEPVSGPGAETYPLKLADDCFAVIGKLEEAGIDNVGFLCDLYHLANNGDDLGRVVDRYGHRVAHVQIADWPGRGQPGTGELPLSQLLARLRARGYDGYVALEYNPTIPTEQTLTSLPPLML
ncbi:MAG: TIM barrel protein [Bifidobacteriaceae bacterium]|jgi:hydroxypyruvate isomerase|nr:TIM barrel protein [Bifidobacteriaceae bacterium]